MRLVANTVVELLFKTEVSLNACFRQEAIAVYAVVVTPNTVCNFAFCSGLIGSTRR